MRNTTNRKKWGAILCAVVVIAFLSIYLAVILFPVVGAALGDTIGMIFLIVYGLIVVGIIVGVVFVFGEGAGQFFLRCVAGLVMGVDGNELAIFIAADISLLFCVAVFPMHMGGFAFAFLIAAEQDGFCAIAAFAVGVWGNLRQGADQIPGTVITEGIMVMDNKIGISADKISVPVTALIGVTVDFQGAVQNPCLLHSTNQYLGNPAGIPMYMFFLSAQGLNRLGIAGQRKLPDGMQGSRQGKGAAQTHKETASGPPCLTEFQGYAEKIFHKTTFLPVAYTITSSLRTGTRRITWEALSVKRLFRVSKGRLPCRGKPAP